MRDLDRWILVLPPVLFGSSEVSANLSSGAAAVLQQFAWVSSAFCLPLVGTLRLEPDRWIFRLPCEHLLLELHSATVSGQKNAPGFLQHVRLVAFHP